MTKSELIARIADISSSNDALKSLNKDILEEAAREIIHRMTLSLAEGPVSYTHLTLPTKA